MTPASCKRSDGAACSPSCAPPAAPTSSSASTASPTRGKPPPPSSCAPGLRRPRRLREPRADHPRPLDEHLTGIAPDWLTLTAAGRTVAVTASSNQHVDALNDTIQHARLDTGELDPATAARSPATSAPMSVRSW